LRLRTCGGLFVESEDGSRRDGVRPRRLALLALLAEAGIKGRSREQILAVLWPDSSPERARAALSQTLYSLNGDLSAEVVSATPAELRLDPSRITSDVDEFRTAVSAKDWARAASLYGGPFLDGFYLNDAPEFERWVDEQRAVLAREGARAIEQAARAATDHGRVEEAAEQWQRLARIDPLNGAYAAKYIEALATRGDRAGALAHGQAHAELVRSELETDPDPEVARALTGLRDRGAKLPVFMTDDGAETALASPDTAARAEESQQSQSKGSTRERAYPFASLRTIAALSVVVVILIAVLGWRTLRWSNRSDTPVLAVGQVRDLVSPDSVQLGGVLSEMLATSIGRLTQLEVIANSRLLELIPQGRETVRAARTDAARRAGATQVLEGELIPLGANRLRFELRRLDIPRGIVRAGYQIDGTDRMALFDSVAVLIASDLGVAPPSRSLAEASTRSPIAYRLYEEGLRALTQQDSKTAYRLFSAAVREDSTFVMATYYRWRSEIKLNLPEQYSTPDRLLGLASHAADRDRLLILTHVRAGFSDPSAVPVAESLIARYPNDPEGLVRASEALADQARAIALLNRAISLDSAAGAERSAYCRLCEAFEMLANRFLSADSLSAAEHATRRWMTFRPKDYQPWAVAAEVHMSAGHRAEAEAAQQHAVSLESPPWDEGFQRLVWSLRSDDLETANEECRAGLARVTGYLLGEYRWQCTISLRAQGRFREALQLLGSAPSYPAQRAILAMSLGDPADAASRFLELASQSNGNYPGSSGRQARNRAWNLTLAGTAFAEAGDTSSVRRLIDSVEAIGRRSLYVRDPRLHHFLRGLLLEKATRLDSAVQEFRAAMTSPTLGYTRVNYELGKSLIALNRPDEAIPVLRAPLHGGLEGSGLYLTRTEAHELLAQAFDATGQADSATAHYAIVERAWRHADPSLQVRYAKARARLTALSASKPNVEARRDPRRPRRGDRSASSPE
jgi:DNA-binding SARP family transcriptional activator